MLTKAVLFLVFLVTFSPGSLFASDFKIARTTEGILQLYGSSCSVLNEEAKLILQWKVRVEGSNNEVIPSCKYDAK
ncbi:MAG: hypothetical protein HY843_04805, partial [Bdellovibrio sp.]|nr:hypothetical protein [Bdellovibrio sp.]